MNENGSHPGRPRERRVDDALLQAGLEVFLEHGYHRASLAEIARRARVGTPAIYRRWPHKADMAIDVVTRENRPEPIPDSGSIRADLAAFVRFRLELWRTPLFHQIILPMHLEAVADPKVSEKIRTAFLGYRQPLGDRIRRSIESGELRRDTEPHRLLDVLMGTIAMPSLFSQELPEPAEAQAIVDQVLEGFAGPGIRRRASHPAARRTVAASGRLRRSSPAAKGAAKRRS
jgi:AcrR family transcriptional regulator